MDTNSENDAVEKKPEVLPETLPPVSVGRQLSEARTKQGLSIADVAASIKFAPRQVIALEADDFSQLPELAFVRGFVRSYARLLHLDEVALLSTLPSAHKQLEDPKEGLADVPLSASQATRKINLFWLFASLGIAVLLGLGIWLFEEKPVEKKIVEDPIALVPIEIVPVVPAVSAVAAVSQVVAAAPIALPLPVNEKILPQPVVVVPPIKLPVLAASAVPVVKLLPPVVVTPVIKLPLAVSAVPVAKPLPPVVALPQVKPVVPPVKDEKPAQAATGVGQIRLVFAVDSWVFITDKYGKTIHKQTNPAGTEQVITGRPPYNVTIANAKNVHLYYEGEQVDLKDFTEISVARLILE
ncbi:MAG: DUF4115 domain-containing protein [Gallionellaceae bacterium]|nr:DUF4115 domain-containing protein [Gallionellaceae bacterium]